MPYFAVALRRVRPGHMESYLANARALAERWATSAGQLSYRLCAAEDDPDRVMLISAWPDPSRFVAASESMPADLRQGVIDDTALVEGEWTWYRPIRTLERFNERPTVLAVSRYRVEASNLSVMEGWSRRCMDALIQIPGVVSISYLAGVEEPTRFLGVSEFSTPESRDRAFEFIHANPQPVDILDHETFSGRVGYQWDRWDQQSAAALER